MLQVGVYMDLQILCHIENDGIKGIHIFVTKAANYCCIFTPKLNQLLLNSNAPGLLCNVPDLRPHLPVIVLPVKIIPMTEEAYQRLHKVLMNERRKILSSKKYAKKVLDQFPGIEDLLQPLANDPRCIAAWQEAKRINNEMLMKKRKGKK